MSGRQGPDEQKRLDKLKRLDILDTLPEAAYDDITFIASHVTEAPISLISLVDEDRQWFKSAVGVDFQETPRDQSFCAHAIRAPHEMMVVGDARQDRRFANNPLVTGPTAIRFYAGAPLVCSDGIALGTLCVIDQRPRTLSEAQERALNGLARQVVAQIELRAALAEVKQLQGMIPMCAHCKKVRQDDGFWERVENYIVSHSDATISHGVCPECLASVWGRDEAPPTSTDSF